MPNSLFQYEMLPTTWFYLSSLMILAVFFKFNRFWSIRNLDLIGLIASGPGLLYLAMYDNQWGYVWIYAVHFLLLIRLLFDTIMVRRPLLEPNLSSDGLTFACIALLAFMVANTTINRGDRVDSSRTIRLEQILSLPSDGETPSQNLKDFPGYRPFFAFVETTNTALKASPTLLKELEERKTRAEKSRTSGIPFPLGMNLLDGEKPDRATDSTVIPPVSAPFPDVAENSGEVGSSAAPSLAGSTAPKETPEPASHPISLLSEAEKKAAPKPLSITVDALSLTTILLTHLLIVLGFLFIGHCHFGNIRTGIAAATLYLLLPYTNQMLGRIDHFIPAALLVWTVALYRHPILSGILLGTASGLVFYPIFLFPLWCGYYWRRGGIRFVGGFVLTMILFISLIFCTPAEYGTFGEQVANMFGRSCFFLEKPDGIWEVWTAFYRIPVIALFLVFSFGLILWPSHKHLATLLSCSAAIMLATQFWQSHQGGLYMGWYLPLLILTVFRPNLEDRVAQTTVVEVKYFF